MGESPAWTIATGTVIISFASTCITGLYATFSGRGHQRLASASALNSAITAATFFTVREYIVSPTIGAVADYSHERRGEEAQNNTAPRENLSWWSLRRHNLLDSGISGAATGGVLRGLTMGRRTVAPAAITAGIACVLFQAAYNELGIQRIKFVGKLSQQPKAVPPPPTPAGPSLTARILGAIGVKTLSDEELLLRLKRERDKHLNKIEELEREVDAEKE
ncbi:hypothetical protein C8F04DRAFT_1062368 [Mycena alexandri]|uniref:Uncharacterized protein n=1 Tax=Mycena alexandri TaxID=1745969 RepID=A0AAD6TIZ4_9AGAR|nr:hypothetical protein C8F04DRAFT_1062368 [Mycena alexandri]